MRGFDRQLFRFILVLALGAGLAATAAQPSKRKVAAREKPAPIILAAAFENAPPSASEAVVGARVDQCSLNPRDYADERPIGDKSDKSAKKRRVVVCG
ncbi:hypothetical protein [Rhodoblastus sp.]|uniref:hypothetical protein n=1 Tax=Rhodoblastus sp. TaxID=1962975 RepID=UPI0035B0B81C